MDMSSIGTGAPDQACAPAMPDFRFGAFPEAEGMAGEGPGRRAAAKVLDNLLFVVLKLAVSFILVIPLVLFAALFGLRGDQVVRALDRNTVVSSVLHLVAYIAYFTAMEGVWGTTPGKRMLGLVVVTEDVGRCSLAQALRRNLLGVIELLAWGIPAFLAIRNSPRAQRHGDRWARTIVPRIEQVPREVRGGVRGFLLASLLALTVIAVTMALTIPWQLAALQADDRRAAPALAAEESPAPAPGSDEAYSAGLEAFNRHDYTAAIDSWKEVVAAVPTHPEAWNAIGLAYWRTGQWDEAATAFLEQVRVAPKHREVWANLGWALQQQGKRREGIAAYREQLKLAPRHNWAHKQLGILLLEEREWRDARDALRTAASIAPADRGVDVPLGRACLKMGETAAAVAAFERARPLDRSPGFLSELAQYLAEDGQALDRAEAWANEALTMASSDSLRLRGDTITFDDVQRSWSVSWAWYALGMSAYHRGDLRAAERYVRAAYDVRASGDIVRDLGRIVEKAGRKSDASRFYAEALALWRDDQDARRLLRQAGVSEGEMMPIAARAWAARTGRRTIRLGRGELPGNSANVLLVLDSRARGAEIRLVRPDARLEPLLARARVALYPVQFPSDTPVRIAGWGQLRRDRATGECVLLLEFGVSPPRE